MRRGPLLIGLCAVAGCGGGSTSTTTVVTSSKVEVVSPSGGDTAATAGRVNFSRLYQREAPGGVTRIALGSRAPRPGAGVVISGSGAGVTNAPPGRARTGARLPRAPQGVV